MENIDDDMVGLQRVAIKTPREWSSCLREAFTSLLVGGVVTCERPYALRMVVALVQPGKGGLLEEKTVCDRCAIPSSNDDGREDSWPYTAPVPKQGGYWMVGSEKNGTADGYRLDPMGRGRALISLFISFIFSTRRAVTSRGRRVRPTLTVPASTTMTDFTS
jgi:hypothetical protein